IELPTTSPSGSKPACLMSRNSLTDRSEVNRPCRFCSNRARPASGMPSSEVGSYGVSRSSVMACSSFVHVGGVGKVSWARDDRRSAEQVQHRFGWPYGGLLLLADRGAD